MVDVQLVKAFKRPERGSDTLTVLGCGESLREDLERFGIQGDVMAVNDAVAYWPHHLDHAVSVHEKVLDPMLGMRRMRDRPMPRYVHALDGEAAGQANVVWRIGPDVAGSGYMGAAIAVAMGYMDIRMLGCGLDGRGHFYDIRRGGTGAYAGEFLAIWRERTAGGFFRDVRVASGPLADVLGRIGE
jgi:hypothetical protein